MPAGQSSHKCLRGQAAWWGEQTVQDTNSPELVSTEVSQRGDGLSSATMGLELIVDGYPARAFGLQARRCRGYVTATSSELTCALELAGVVLVLVSFSFPSTSSLSSNKRVAHVYTLAARVFGFCQYAGGPPPLDARSNRPQQPASWKWSHIHPKTETSIVCIDASTHLKT